MSRAICEYRGDFGRIALLDVDRPLVLHAHPQCHVLLKACGMDAHFSVRGAVQPLRDDTAVLVNTWEPHAYVQVGEQAPDTVFLALYLDTAWVREVDPRLKGAAGRRFFEHPITRLGRGLRRRIDNLVEEMSCAQGVGRDWLEGEIESIVMDVVGAGRGRGIGPPDGLRSAPDRRIRRALDLLQTCAGDDRDIDDLACAVGLSRAHFFKLFREATGLTPHLYLNTLRMESALRTLACSDVTLSRLSTDLGFSAQGHFTRFFEQRMGTVPSQYRRVVSVLAHGPGFPEACADRAANAEVRTPAQTGSSSTQALTAPMARMESASQALRKFNLFLDHDSHG